METQASYTTHLPLEILQASRIFFTSKGFDQTSITDITDFLDIDRAAFHNHFDNLDEILEILWEDSYQGLRL